MIKTFLNLLCVNIDYTQSNNDVVMKLLDISNQYSIMYVEYNQKPPTHIQFAVPYECKIIAYIINIDDNFYIVDTLEDYSDGLGLNIEKILKTTPITDEEFNTIKLRWVRLAVNDSPGE